MNPTDIKALAPMKCPHCGKDMVVEFKSMAPQVTAAFSPQEINDAKEKALREIEALPIPLERKKEALGWIRDPDVIFSPNDVDAIIQSVLDETKNDTPETIKT